jgi:uncharacterized protein (DUF3820 family)
VELMDVSRHDVTPTVLEKIDAGSRSSNRLDHLSMPIGKYRDCLIRAIPEFDREYADWMAAQLWFRQKYPAEALALARAVKFWVDPISRQRIEDERRRSHKAKEAERLAQIERDEQEWLDRHKVAYEPRGFMPFAKYKGHPLADVARNEFYCRWFKGTAYARMNPELAADLKAAVETIASRPMVSVEHHDGGCVVLRPAIWCRAESSGTNNG